MAERTSSANIMPVGIKMPVPLEFLGLATKRARKLPPKEAEIFAEKVGAAIARGEMAAARNIGDLVQSCSSSSLPANSSSALQDDEAWDNPIEQWVPLTVVTSGAPRPASRTGSAQFYQTSCRPGSASRRGKSDSGVRSRRPQSAQRSAGGMHHTHNSSLLSCSDLPPEYSNDATHLDALVSRLVHAARGNEGRARRPASAVASRPGSARTCRKFSKSLPSVAPKLGLCQDARKIAPSEELAELVVQVSLRDSAFPKHSSPPIVTSASVVDGSEDGIAASEASAAASPFALARDPALTDEGSRTESASVAEMKLPSQLRPASAPARRLQHTVRQISSAARRVSFSPAEPTELYPSVELEAPHGISLSVKPTDMCRSVTFEVDRSDEGTMTRSTLAVPSSSKNMPAHKGLTLAKTRSGRRSLPSAAAVTEHGQGCPLASKLPRGSIVSTKTANITSWRGDYRRSQEGGTAAALESAREGHGCPFAGARLALRAANAVLACSF